MISPLFLCIKSFYISTWSDQEKVFTLIKFQNWFRFLGLSARDSKWDVTFRGKLSTCVKFLYEKNWDSIFSSCPWYNYFVWSSAFLTFCNMVRKKEFLMFCRIPSLNNFSLLYFYKFLVQLFLVRLQWQ